MRLDWRGGLGLLVTGFLLWFVLRGVDLSGVWEEVQGADFFLLALAVAVATVTFLLRALRWKILLAPIHPGTSFRSRFAAVNIGFMANNLLPARVGEFARAYALSRMELVPASGAFASLVVERFLDGLAIVFFMMLAVAAPGFPRELLAEQTALGGIIQGVMVILGGLLAFMLLLLLFPRKVVAAAERASRFPPAGGFSGSISGGAEGLPESSAAGSRRSLEPGRVGLAVPRVLDRVPGLRDPGGI